MTLRYAQQTMSRDEIAINTLRAILLEIRRSRDEMEAEELFAKNLSAPLRQMALYHIVII